MLVSLVRVVHDLNLDEDTDLVTRQNPQDDITTRLCNLGCDLIHSVSLCIQTTLAAFQSLVCETCSTISCVIVRTTTK